MARLVVQHETDPSIGVIFEHVEPNDPVRARGWHGKCTECGHVMHRWSQTFAFASGSAHVKKHESGL